MESSQIPTLTLPSGGTVEFVDLDDLTGEDLAAMRRAVGGETNPGEQTNKLIQHMMKVAIKSWHIPYLPDPSIPQANPAAWKKLKFRDSIAIQRALKPLLDIVNGDEAAASIDDVSPGSPTQPDGD